MPRSATSSSADDHQDKETAGYRAISVFIFALGLVSFASAFHTVALYPLLKFVIAVLIALPLCFLISSFIRKIPLADRML